MNYLNIYIITIIKRYFHWGIDMVPMSRTSSPPHRAAPGASSGTSAAAQSSASSARDVPPSNAAND